MNINTKEFDRSVCFTFYKSYLEQAKEVISQFGIEDACTYLIELAEYGLYQKEPTAPISKLLISGLKNTIDVSQERRAKGFSGENKELTAAVLKYKSEHPDATQREIADAVNCSLGKVNKVLSNPNYTPDGNTNTDSDSSSTNNSMNVNMNTLHPEAANTAKPTAEKKQSRWLDDLSDEELESISNDFVKRVDYKKTKDRLNLSYNVSKDTHIEAESILADRRKQEKHNKIIKGLDSISDEDIKQLTSLFRCEKHELQSKLIENNVDANYVLEWIPVHGDAASAFDKYEEYQNEYKTYDNFLKMLFRSNNLYDTRHIYYP